MCVEVVTGAGYHSRLDGELLARNAKLGDTGLFTGFDGAKRCGARRRSGETSVIV